MIPEPFINSGLFVNAKSIHVFVVDVICVGSLINCSNWKGHDFKEGFKTPTHYTYS
jgi:hypothetical protein